MASEDPDVITSGKACSQGLLSLPGVSPRSLPKIIVIGGGGFCTQVLDAFECSGIRVSGIVDDRLKGFIFDIPIVGTLSQLEQGLIEYDSLFCAIGDPDIREEIFKRFPNKWVNCIHPKACISHKASLGTGNYIGPNVSIMPRATIGWNNIIDPNIVVSHDVKIGSHNHLAALSCLLGRAKIGDRNLIGAGGSILPDLVVGSGNLLGSGAVLTKSIGDNQVLKGVPAKE